MAHIVVDIDLFHLLLLLSDQKKTIFGHIIQPGWIMKLSKQIKPISYLKAHAAEIARTLGEQHDTMIITQNGEAKFIIQDIETYEQTQETLALLKILALGNKQIEEGRTKPASEVFSRIRSKHKDR
jgi:PHD/YefM family antitoxin component YafN of YafNO toxin-antitoxin module